MSATQSTWTVDLVQQHAQVAVAVELYTLPFYLTAMTSIKDPSEQAYQTILSVCMEEMFHLELAANLCLALGTTPNFKGPQFGKPLPFFDPDDPATGHHALVNAVLGPLNETTLQTMLDIETPEELDPFDNTTPQYPYNSIGAFYRALRDGIRLAGVENFPWTTTGQQFVWTSDFAERISEVITNFDQATEAITAITEQGEGKRMKVVPLPPFTPEQFPIPEDYQLQDPGDPSPLNGYSHFGRFIAIQNAPLPFVYPAVPNPTTEEQRDAIAQLKGDFESFVDNLNSTWACQNDFNIPLMTGLTDNAVACWKAGVIPQWSLND